jgi:hypothetical protein
MFTRFNNWLRGLFDHRLVMLTIVRRYQDAQGHNVGELYMYSTLLGVGAYRLIGCSLDSFPLDLTELSQLDESGALDLVHDFLAPMGAYTLRVGAPEPQDNDTVRRMIAYIPRKNIRLNISNRFVEHVIDSAHSKCV